MKGSQYHPLLHVAAVLTACATFPLIFMGGLVTSHKAGMSVPDWPNSFHYNMFLFPPSKWVGGVFYEHTHRLMATLVGLFAIALVICAWKLERRRWAFWLSVTVLIAVIVQGVLGGLRVVLVDLDLAIVHACFAQAFFCLAVLEAIVTSRWWLRAPALREVENTGLDARTDEKQAGRWLVRLGIIAVCVIYGQLVIGAFMRHFNAGLAIPDFPTSYGHWFPPTNSQQLAAANQLRADDSIRQMVHGRSPTLDPVTLGQIWIHFAHRIGAILVTIAVSLLVIVAIRRAIRQRAKGIRTGLLGISLLLISCLMGQLTLGILTVLLRKPADVASAHVALGALTLVIAFSLTVMAMRLYNPRAETWREAAFEVQPAGGGNRRRSEGAAEDAAEECLVGRT